MKQAMTWVVYPLLLILVGCGFGPPPLTQAQMNALETREVDADLSETFRAASGALFDAGYTISMSDRGGGLLTGTKRIDRSRQRRSAYHRARRTSQDGRAANYVPIEDTVYTISIMIRESDPERCSVRVKTAVNGAPKVNKQAIDEIWTLMQRQVLMKAPLAATTGYQN